MKHTARLPYPALVDPILQSRIDSSQGNLSGKVSEMNTNIHGSLAMSLLT